MKLALLVFLALIPIIVPRILFSRDKDAARRGTNGSIELRPPRAITWTGVGLAMMCGVGAVIRSDEPKIVLLAVAMGGFAISFFYAAGKRRVYISRRRITDRVAWRHVRFEWDNVESVTALGNPRVQSLVFQSFGGKRIRVGSEMTGWPELVAEIEDIASKSVRPMVTRALREVEGWSSNQK